MPHHPLGNARISARTRVVRQRDAQGVALSADTLCVKKFKYSLSVNQSLRPTYPFQCNDMH